MIGRLYVVVLVAVVTVKRWLQTNNGKAHYCDVSPIFQATSAVLGIGGVLVAQEIDETEKENRELSQTENAECGPPTASTNLESEVND